MTDRIILSPPERRDNCAEHPHVVGSEQPSRHTNDLLAVFRIQRVDFGVRKIVHDFNERNALFRPCLEFLSSRPTHGVRPRRELPRHAGLDACIALLTQAWRVLSASPAVPQSGNLWPHSKLYPLWRVDDVRCSSVWLSSCSQTLFAFNTVRCIGRLAGDQLGSAKCFRHRGRSG